MMARGLSGKGGFSGSCAAAEPRGAAMADGDGAQWREPPGWRLAPPGRAVHRREGARETRWAAADPGGETSARG